MNTPSALKKDLHITKATWKDFLLLAHYHYIQTHPPPYDSIYKICDKVADRRKYPDPVAVILFSFPVPHIKARNRATDNFFTRPKGRHRQLVLINKYIRYISRVIVDPRYRRLHLATWLIKHTLKLQTKPIIETITPIDFTNRMFINCGFKLYLNPAPTRHRRFLDDLAECGISGDMLRHPTIVQKRIDSLPDEKQEHLYFRLKRFLMQYSSAQKEFWQPVSIAYALTKLSYPQAYLIFRAKNQGKTPRHRL